MMFCATVINSYGQTYWSIKDYSEQDAKRYFNANDLDPVEGIWQSTDGFKYAIEKDVDDEGARSDSRYRVVVLEDVGWWEQGYIKAFIESSAVNAIYPIKYYTNSQNGDNLEIQNCFGLLENPAMFTFTRIDNGLKIMFVKLYPKIDDATIGSVDNELEKSSGTGFALSTEGYIVTNYHVAGNARSIEVKGVNGDFSRKLSAELVVSDERNDLAIIRINDPAFFALDNIPYTFRQGIADVGESVFVLGYPMTSTMGEEVKLTNGIISSKTGFQGDISMYQISAPIQPGSSGGPLFDKDGQLIGIVSAKHILAENAGYAMKLNYIKNLIELLPVPIVLPEQNQLYGKSLSEQVKLASRFTYLILINDRTGLSSNPVTGNQPDSDFQKAQSYFAQAYNDFQNDNMQSAINNLSSGLALDPNNAAAYELRGYLYVFEIRNYMKGIEDFTRAIQIKPDSKDSYFYRAMAYRKLEKDVEAIKDFTRTISLDKDNVNAYYGRAMAKSVMNDKIGAIADYDEIIKREETAQTIMGTVYNNKAYCLVELGQYHEAMPLVNKALELEPNTSFIWDTRGEIYYHLGDYNQCIDDMNKAIDITEGETSYDNSYYYRGLAKIRLGQRDDGCRDLSKAGEQGKEEAYNDIKEFCGGDKN
jgi:S1-C subfamily serine protease/Tfp pilus assembly protein PilF